MNAEGTPRTDIDNTFVEIIGNEYGPHVAEVLGEAAVQIEPFGNQFMSDLPEAPPSPTATSPGGRTSSIRNGQACLDDPTSSDTA